MGIGLGGLLEEGAHEKSPKCLGGNLGDFGGILQRSQYANRPSEKPTSGFQTAYFMTHAAGRETRPPIPLIRFQNHFHGLVFSGVFEHVVGFFQFAEFETVGQHFGVIH